MNMNHRTIRIAALFVALTACAVSITGAKGQKSKGIAAKSAPFSVTGVYSGSISGEMVVNGQSVFVNDKTSIQRVGKGPVSMGESVSNSAVIVSGVMKGKKAIATMVLIGEPETSNDFTQTTIEGAERDPKTSKRAR